MFDVSGRWIGAKPSPHPARTRRTSPARTPTACTRSSPRSPVDQPDSPRARACSTCRCCNVRCGGAPRRCTSSRATPSEAATATPPCAATENHFSLTLSGSDLFASPDAPAARHCASTRTRRSALYESPRRPGRRDRQGHRACRTPPPRRHRHRRPPTSPRVEHGPRPPRPSQNHPPRHGDPPPAASSSPGRAGPGLLT